MSGDAGTDAGRSASAPRGGRWQGWAVTVGLAALMLLAPVPASAEREGGPPRDLPEASEQDGPGYPVDGFRLRYLREHPRLPDIEAYQDLTVRLGRVEDGYVAPRTDVPAEEVSLGQIAEAERTLFYASAVQVVIERLRDELVDRDLMGVFVGPDPLEIDERGRDLRGPNDRDLTLVLTVGQVTELRSRATGQRFEEQEDVIDRPEHAPIRRQSPIQAGEERDPRQDLLERGVIEDYAYWLSRHPGRNVEVALAADDEPGGVVVDYLVNENKPWAVFGQLSNTGTAATGRLRQEFGFFHNQLTGNDDIFRLQYLTAGFDGLHGVAGSYDAPFPGQQRDTFRYAIEGVWSQFRAEDIGAFDDTFRGTSLSLGGEVSANVFQRGNFFIDTFAGARYLRVSTSDTLTFTEDGREDFFLPRVGVRAERGAAWYDSFAELMLEGQVAGLSSVDRAALGNLGRPDADADWATLRWDLRHAFFLEPLLFPQAWEQVDQEDVTRLSHQFALSFSGQYGFDNRLIPQLTRTAGGMHTVRGYPEAAVAGDSVLIGRAEYRFHLTRALPLERTPRDFMGEPFRFAPQYVYGPTDWELVPRAFVDVGRTFRNATAGTPEAEETLVGAGVGFEVAWQRNVRFRLDYGVALSGAPSRDVQRGDSRVHFLLTLLY